MDVSRLGQRAKELLADPEVKEILDLIEQELTQSWKDGKHQTDREDAWYTLQGHQRFLRTLEILESNYVLNKTLDTAKE